VAEAIRVRVTTLTVIAVLTDSSELPKLHRFNPFETGV
jgi:hypothetical protein